MLMELLSNVWPFVSTILAFVIVIVPLVFVHEFGHFWVARKCGVHVEVFSIGFGKEWWTFTDKHGTKWRFCPLLLGGYVKMFGDADPASAQSRPELRDLPPEQKAKAFFAKSIAQRSAIVAAGPGINFLFAIILLYGLFLSIGQTYMLPKIQELIPGKPAEAVGMLPGDLITSINGQKIEAWNDIRRVMTFNLDKPVVVKVERDHKEISFDINPTLQEDNIMGMKSSRGLLGIKPDPEAILTKKYNVLTALPVAIEETFSMAGNQLSGLWQIVSGQRKTEEMGGVISIAKMSRSMVETVAGGISFVASLSVVLGVINLLPIPVLDGGHLLFYGIEAIRRRPLTEQTQEYSLRFGFVLILTVMVFALWNDLRNNGVVEYLTKLLN